MSWTGVIVMTAILTTIRLAVPLITKNDKENDIVKVADEKKPGFELQPGYVKVTASYSKAWNDAKESPIHTSLAILSLLVCLAGPTVWFKMVDGKDGKGFIIWGSLVVLGIGTILPHYIVPVSLKHSVNYTKKICLKDYTEGKNYDYLFPETDEQKISLEQFENSCR